MNLRDELTSLRTEVNCRIEHGADSGGHLEYVQAKLDAILAALPAVESVWIVTWNDERIVTGRNAGIHAVFAWEAESDAMNDAERMNRNFPDVYTATMWTVIPKVRR